MTSLFEMLLRGGILESGPSSPCDSRVALEDTLDVRQPDELRLCPTGEHTPSLKTGSRTIGSGLADGLLANLGWSPFGSRHRFSAPAGT
jgi:hypothetical protein